jgi:hypothetical protein
VDGFSEETKVVVGVALVIVWFCTLDVLAPKFESPPYTALIALVPTPSAEYVRLAEPPLSVPVPNTVEVFINVTISPSGGAPTLDVTVAVKSTSCPKTDGFGVGRAKAVVVVALFTTWFNTVDVLALKFESPP